MEVWSVEDARPEPGFGFVIRDECGLQVARVDGPSCEADTRLIAAAPDLLRELLELVNLLDNDAEVITTKHAWGVLAPLLDSGVTA